MKSNEIQIKLLELEIDKLSKELMNQKCLAAEYKGKYEGIHEIYKQLAQDYEKILKRYIDSLK